MLPLIRDPVVLLQLCSTTNNSDRPPTKQRRVMQVEVRVLMFCLVTLKSIRKEWPPFATSQRVKTTTSGYDNLECRDLMIVACRKNSSMDCRTTRWLSRTIGREAGKSWTSSMKSSNRTTVSGMTNRMLSMMLGIWIVQWEITASIRIPQWSQWVVHSSLARWRARLTSTRSSRKKVNCTYLHSSSAPWYSLRTYSWEKRK